MYSHRSRLGIESAGWIVCFVLGIHEIPVEGFWLGSWDRGCVCFVVVLFEGFLLKNARGREWQWQDTSHYLIDLGGLSWKFVPTWSAAFSVRDVCDQLSLSPSNSIYSCLWLRYYIDCVLLYTVSTRTGASQLGWGNSFHYWDFLECFSFVFCYFRWLVPRERANKTRARFKFHRKFPPSFLSFFYITSLFFTRFSWCLFSSTTFTTHTSPVESHKIRKKVTNTPTCLFSFPPHL